MVGLVQKLMIDLTGSSDVAGAAREAGRRGEVSQDNQVHINEVYNRFLAQLSWRLDEVPV